MRSEKPYAIRDEVTMGLPYADGKTTGLPKSEKFETSTMCMQLSLKLVMKSARLSGDIPRLYVAEKGVDRESKRIKVGLYRNRMIIPSRHKQ